MRKKIFRFLAACSLVLASVFTLSGCGRMASSKDATKDNPFKIRMAHGLGPEHSVSKAIVQFAEEVKEKTDGRIVINITDNGSLSGGESGYLEMLKESIIGMTKVSAPGLANYDETYHAFGLPYLFNSQEEYYEIMDSPEMREIFLRSSDKGFVTLTWYTSGVRSMYSSEKILAPSDMVGKTYRVQDMETQTAMIGAWGGTSSTMSVGDVYSALSTGQLDGAESNETVLTLGSHGEVCKYFTYTEHTMIPDILAMSSDIWNRIDEADQQIMLTAAYNSTQAHKVMWDESIELAKKQAIEKYGVEFITLTTEQKQVFIDSTQSVRDKFVNKYSKINDILDIINAKRTA